MHVLRKGNTQSENQEEIQVSKKITEQKGVVKQ
jgi:hypothetical protein